MFCSFCGKSLAEGTYFCPYCGKKVEPQTNARGETAPDSGADTSSRERTYDQYRTNDEKRKKRSLIEWLILAGAAVVLILGITVPQVHNAQKNARSQKMYENAEALLENGDYENAREAFQALGDFEDAPEQVTVCSKAQVYQQAITLYQSGDYEAAAELFSEADSYQDAYAMRAECMQRVAYAKAVLLIESGDYEAAERVIQPLDEKLFSDKSALLDECTGQAQEARNLAVYQQAQQALAQGNNYEAYGLFSGLGDFQDSAALAASCIVTKPDSGETYYNSAYSGDDCTLEINPPSDGSSTYAKIYTSGGDLVVCLFMNPGDTASVNLPAGDYCIRVAYGDGDWYGEKDMFGDDGVYQQLLMSDTSENFTFEYDYDYTLTLQTTDRSGVSVANKNVDRDSF